MRATMKEQQILPLAGSFVRYLGGFEHLHWLFSQSGPRAFAPAIEVTGTTTVKQWRAALAALQLSQPFFSVLIDVDDDSRPYFRRVNGSPIPMRVLDAKFAASWEDEMGKEVSTMISVDHAPFFGQFSSTKRSVPSSSSQLITRSVTEFPWRQLLATWCGLCLANN